MNCDFVRLGEIRDWVRDRSNAAGLPSPLLDELLIVVSELATNAIQHSHDSDVVVFFSCDESSVSVEVSGADAFDAAAPRELSSVDDPAGRGVFIVQALTDTITMIEREGRTFVRCTKDVQTHDSKSGT